MKEPVLVSKINKKNEIALKVFYDFFKEENIEYEARLEEEWIGIRQPKYIANIALYVNKNDETKVKKFIEQLQNATIKNEEYNELNKYTKEEENEHDQELQKYEKRQKRLQKIMIYGIFLVVGICCIISIISNIIN